MIRDQHFLTSAILPQTPAPLVGTPASGTAHAAQTHGFGIVHEDPDLLVVNKPSDLVCHPTKAGPWSSLVGRVRCYLGTNSPIHLVNRLDRETTGLVLIAKTEETARELRLIWERREVQKDYLAIVSGRPNASHTVINAPIGADTSSQVAIKNRVRTDGASAVTEYWLLRPILNPQATSSLLRVRPHTGRKHQIRVHLAWAKHPVLGDKIYGPDERLYLAFVAGQLSALQRTQLALASHALHALSLRLRWQGQDWHFRAEPEPWFSRFAGRNLSESPL